MVKLEDTNWRSLLNTRISLTYSLKRCFPLKYSATWRQAAFRDTINNWELENAQNTCLISLKCTGTSNSNTKSSSTKPTASNTGTRMLAVIGGVARMRNFRHYLADGPGRKLYDFWMDAERFFRIPAKDERSRWLKYREIQITFCELETPATKKMQRLEHNFDADSKDNNSIRLGHPVQLCTRNAWSDTECRPTWKIMGY